MPDDLSFLRNYEFVWIDGKLTMVEREPAPKLPQMSIFRRTKPWWRQLWRRR